MSITRLNAALEGRYRIESELGEGGMATVYLADDIASRLNSVVSVSSRRTSEAQRPGHHAGGRLSVLCPVSFQGV